MEKSMAVECRCGLIAHAMKACGKMMNTTVRDYRTSPADSEVRKLENLKGYSKTVNLRVKERDSV